MRGTAPITSDGGILANFYAGLVKGKEGHFSYILCKLSMMLHQPPILDYQKAGMKFRPLGIIAAYYAGTTALLWISIVGIVVTGDAESAGGFPFVALVVLAMLFMPAGILWLAVFLLHRVGDWKMIRTAGGWRLHCATDQCNRCRESSAQGG